MRSACCSWSCFSTAFSALLAVALGSSSSEAAIPTYGQSSLSKEPDIQIVLPDGENRQSGRYDFKGLTYIVAADPADPTRQVVQLTLETFRGLSFEQGSEASMLIVEWEQYHSQEGGSNCMFFGLTDTDEQQANFQRTEAVTRFKNLPGPGDVNWSENLPLDQWVRLRLEYSARTGGPGANDGTLVLKMDAGLGLVTVATVTDHDMTNIAEIGLCLSEGTTTQRLAAWRKLVWDGTGLDMYGAAANPDSLWRDIGHQIGAMEPDGQGGVRSTVWVHYNVGLYGAAITDYAADVQIDTDADFSSPITQTVPITAAGAYNGVATFDGLLPNCAYHVRAQLKRDDAVVATTYSTSFRTVSVPGGAPGKLHLLHGSCSNTDAEKGTHVGRLQVSMNDPLLVRANCCDGARSGAGRPGWFGQFRHDANHGPLRPCATQRYNVQRPRGCSSIGRASAFQAGDRRHKRRRINDLRRRPRDPRQ